VIREVVMFDLIDASYVTARTTEDAGSGGYVRANVTHLPS
jgi:hypothetical protein